MALCLVTEQVHSWFVCIITTVFYIGFARNHFNKVRLSLVPGEELVGRLGFFRIQCAWVHPAFACGSTQQLTTSFHYCKKQGFLQDSVELLNCVRSIFCLVIKGVFTVEFCEFAAFVV